MTYLFQPNNIVTNRGEYLFYEWKEFMTSSGGPGWSVQSSSDGSLFDGSGDIITSGGTGSGGLGNTNAWFLIESPISKQFLFYKTSGTSDFFIYYSRDGYFSGGGVGVRPTATDEQIIFASSNGSTGATIGYDGASSNVYNIYHFGANDSDGYGFYIAGYSKNSGTTNAGYLAMEEVSFVTDGYSDDSCVIFVCGNEDTPANNYTAEYGIRELSDTNNYHRARVLAYMKSGINSEVFTTVIPFMQITSYQFDPVLEFFPQGLNRNLLTRKYFCGSIMYGKRFRNGFNTARGIKGIGDHILYNGRRYPYGNKIRVNHEAIPHRAFVSIGDFLFPFPENEPVIRS